jgi:hypothetical protein
MPATIVLLLPVLSLVTSAAAENPRLTPPPFTSSAVGVMDQETRRNTSDAPTVPSPPELPRIRSMWEAPDVPIEHQVAVAEVLVNCFIVGAFSFMAVFGCWKLVEFRNGRRKRLLGQAATAGPSPGKVEAVSKWLRGLAQHTDPIEDPGKAERETRDTRR